MFSSTDHPHGPHPDQGESAHRFADGELGASEAAAFEAHLAGCLDCQEELGSVLLLRGRILELPSLPALTFQRGRWWRSRRGLGLGVGLAALGAAAAVAVVLLAPARPPSALAQVFSEGEQRPLLERLTYEPAGRHRRPPAVMRSGRLAAAVPIEALTAARTEGDLHGELALWLWAGDHTEASAVAARLPEDPAVDNDLAVLALRRSRLDEAQQRLDRILLAQPGNTAARWNRALLAERRHDRASAIRDYEAVIAAQEIGWADEARQRVLRLRTPAASPPPSPSPSGR